MKVVMAEVQTSGGSADRTWRLRWALLASCITCLAALWLVKGTLALGWHWSLFLYGVAVGMAAAMLDVVWLDIGIAVYLVVVAAASVVVLRRLERRLQS
jgi:hypothetical protein